MHEGFFNKGKALNDGLEALEPSDWVTILDADVFLPKNYRKEVMDAVRNPGFLFYASRLEPPYEKAEEEIDRYMSYSDQTQKTWPVVQEYPICGFLLLVNTRASVLKPRGLKWFLECYETAGEVDAEFVRLYQDANKISNAPEFQVVHIPHGISEHTLEGVNWRGRKSKRFIIESRGL